MANLFAVLMPQARIYAPTEPGNDRLIFDQHGMLVRPEFTVGPDRTYVVEPSHARADAAPVVAVPTDPVVAAREREEAVELIRSSGRRRATPMLAALQNAGVLPDVRAMLERVPEDSRGRLLEALPTGASPEELRAAWSQLRADLAAQLATAE